MKEDDVEIKREIEVCVPEHQVLLGFNSDYQAQHFHDWWECIGREIFIDYVIDKDKG